jgi:hypothetical protein
MLHLLKIEWLKIKSYRAFWVFSLLYLASIFLLNYIGWSTQQRVLGSSAEGAAMNPYAFPKVWQTVTWMSSWLLYFPGMLMIMLMANEFTFKTHRQNVIDGLSRQQFIGVKILLVLILAVITVVLNFITAIIFGSKSQGAFSTTGIEYIGYSFLQALLYMFFALLLAVLFRRSGLAIIIFILYGLIFEWLISATLTFNLKVAPYSYFLPLQTSDVLIPVPFGKQVFYPDVPSAGALIAGIAAYLFIYLFFTRKKFVTDDL